MKHHFLKTDPEVFQASWDEIKGFEIRFNDRDYRPGDTLTLAETSAPGEEMKSGASLVYTGREIDQEVDYVLHGPIYGLQPGWVILSVAQTAYRAL